MPKQTYIQHFTWNGSAGENRPQTASLHKCLDILTGIRSLTRDSVFQQEMQIKKIYKSKTYNSRIRWWSPTQLLTGRRVAWTRSIPRWVPSQGDGVDAAWRSWWTSPIVISTRAVEDYRPLFSFLLDFHSNSVDSQGTFPQPRGHSFPLALLSPLQSCNRIPQKLQIKNSNEKKECHSRHHKHLGQRAFPRSACIRPIWTRKSLRMRPRGGCCSYGYGSL
jgi:hypothetical protein